MFNASNCAPALITSVSLTDAKQRLETFATKKAAAVDAGNDTTPLILDFLTEGLPLCIRMVSDADPSDLQQALELLDIAQSELAAAVHSRAFLIDASQLRDLNLLAALVVDAAYTALNAIETCIASESFTDARFAVKAYEGYADRYEQLMAFAVSLPRNLHVAEALEEIGYYHAMVMFAEAKLGSHLDWLKAKNPSKNRTAIPKA